MAKSLLVIDDSTTIRAAIQLALTGGEWETINATTSAEAMDALRQHRVDAVLCDVALADEDGYEVCRTLGASAEGSGVPILLMGGQVNATAALSVGAAATLPKPFTAEQVQKALQEVLDRSDFSFDFDISVEPLPVAYDDEPLELTPLTASFELPKGAGSGSRLTPEEIEVIDLGDDDQFDELELLDDLQPVEFAPVGPAEDADLFGDQDLGTSPEPPLRRGDLGQLLDPSPAAPTAAALEFDAISLAGEPFAAQPGANGAADLGNELDLEGLLDSPPGGVDALEGVPMELGPGSAPLSKRPRQAQGGAWTVDGLHLGDEPAAPAAADLLDTEFPLADAESGTGPGTPDDPLETPVVALEEVPADTQRAARDAYAGLEKEWERETVAQAPADADFSLEELLQPSDTESAVWETAGETLWDAAPAKASPALGDELPPAVPGDSTEDLELAMDDLIGEPGVAEEPAGGARGPTKPAPADDRWSAPDTSAGAEVPPTTTETTEDTQALAAAIAASAGQAVREALQQSLSAEHLAPLVAAAVERVAWEVVPQLAERLIRETIARLQEEPPAP